VQTKHHARPRLKPLRGPSPMRAEKGLSLRSIFSFRRHERGGTQPDGRSDVDAHICDRLRTALDDAGGIVIPEQIRTELSLEGGDEVEVVLACDRIEIVRAPQRARPPRPVHKT